MSHESVLVKCIQPLDGFVGEKEDPTLGLTMTVPVKRHNHFLNRKNIGPILSLKVGIDCPRDSQGGSSCSKSKEDYLP